MERVVEKVIKTIETEAHTSGLTDRIRVMLNQLLDIEEDVNKEEEEDYKEELIQ